MAKRMTKARLVRHLADHCEVSNRMAQILLDEFAKTAVRETRKKGNFVMPGIGRLVKSNRKARLGRNPATGESIRIPAKTVVKFRVAKAVKDAFLSRPFILI